MTENNNAVETLNLLDLKIADAREDFAKVQAKLYALLVQKENADRIDAVAVGDSVTVKYGRGEKARELNGVVLARDGENIAVQTGEGLDIQVVKVATSAIIFPIIAE